MYVLDALGPEAGAQKLLCCNFSSPAACAPAACALDALGPEAGAQKRLPHCSSILSSRAYRERLLLSQGILGDSEHTVVHVYELILHEHLHREAWEASVCKQGMGGVGVSTGRQYGWGKHGEAWEVSVKTPSLLHIAMQVGLEER